MSNSRSRRRRRIVFITVAAAALAFAAYAFTASNTVPASRAGDGNGAISGYTVSNIRYELDATSPANIGRVTFTLDAAATTVKARVVSASTTYTDCTNTGGNNPQRVTELTDAQSLHRVAEHHDRIVLHWREGHDHVYEVDDGGSVYRYRFNLGVEPGLGVAAGEDDTLVLPPTKLPRRAAAG